MCWRGGVSHVCYSLPFLLQIATTINMIAYCQNSSYGEWSSECICPPHVPSPHSLSPPPHPSLSPDGLAAETHIQKYLQHTRYIDELLKFFEDEQYK